MTITISFKPEDKYKAILFVGQQSNKMLEAKSARDYEVLESDSDFIKVFWPLSDTRRCQDFVMSLYGSKYIKTVNDEV